MYSLVAISASPYEESRTGKVADLCLSRLASDDLAVRHMRLRDLPAGALVRGDTTEPEVAHALATVADADGLFLVTPTYHASYSGLLKLFLDLLPRQALNGKVVLPLVIVGSRAHVLALDYAVMPVLNALGARRVVRGHCLLGEQLHLVDDTVVLDAEVDRALGADLECFRRAVVGGAEWVTGLYAGGY